MHNYEVTQVNKSEHDDQVATTIIIAIDYTSKYPYSSDLIALNTHCVWKKESERELKWQR